MAGEGWTNIKLDDVCTKIGSGATPKGGSSVYLDTGNIALIRSQNVYNDGFKINGLVYISQEHADQLSNVEVQHGDVLLNITGDSVARCCRVNPQVLPARVNQHVAIIRTDPSQLNAQYLRYYLIAPQTQELMLSWAGSGGTRNALTKGMIEAFEIIAPEDVKEQQAIACILSALDDKIELNQRMNRTLEAMARAIFKSWFVDFDPVRGKANGGQPPGLAPYIADLFPDSFDDSDLGEIPRGWKTGVLEDLFILQRGFDLPTKKRIPGPYQVIAASGPSTYHNEAKVKGPGVVTGRSGVLGKVFFIQDDFWPLNTTLWVKKYKGSLPCHAYFFLKTFDLSIFNAGSAVPTLNRNHIHNLPVIIPDYEVVKHFETFAGLLFKRQRDSEEESNTLSDIRDALLPKLTSGDLRVPDAERIVGRCA